MAVFLTQSLCKTYMNYSRMTVEPFAEKDPPSHHQVVLPCNIIIRFKKGEKKRKESQKYKYLSSLPLENDNER